MCETAAASCHCRDISDRAWNILAPLLPVGPGKVGRPAQDNCRSSTPFLGTPHPRPLARPAGGLRTLEHYLHPLLSLAQKGI